MALSWKSYLANEIICWSVGCTNHLSSYILQEISGVKQEPKEEKKFKFDLDLNQEPSQDVDQRHQTEWTIKQEPEEENEIKFDSDLNQEPSQDFGQRHQTEWTIKQEPEDENDIKFDPELNQKPSQDFDQRQQEKKLTFKQDQGNSFGKSSLNEVTFILFFKKRNHVSFIYMNFTKED